MAEGVVVFDSSPEVLVADGESERTLVVQGGDPDLFVVDPGVVRQIFGNVVEDLTDFLVFDAPIVTAETLVAEPDLLLIDPVSVPAQVVLGPDGSQDFLVITPGGPPGPEGPQGDPGPQGLPGLAGPGAYYQEFGFASPVNTWTIVHNQNSMALSVETVDVSGGPLEGYVRYLDLNTIEVDWYYPTAGTARVFR